MKKLNLKQRLEKVSKKIELYYEKQGKIKKQALTKEEAIEKLKNRMLKLKELLEKGTDALENALMSGKNTFAREIAFVSTVLKDLKQTQNTLDLQTKEASVKKIDENTKYAVELIKLAMNLRKNNK